MVDRLDLAQSLQLVVEVAALTTQQHREVQVIVQVRAAVEIQAEVVVVVVVPVQARIQAVVVVAQVVLVLGLRELNHQLVPELLDKDILEVEADIVQAIVLVMVAQD
jgi:hypothetical protein